MNSPALAFICAVRVQECAVTTHRRWIDSSATGTSLNALQKSTAPLRREPGPFIGASRSSRELETKRPPTGTVLSRCSIALTRSWIRGPQWRAVAQVVRESLRARLHPSLWVRVRGCICPPRGRNSRHTPPAALSPRPHGTPFLSTSPTRTNLNRGRGMGSVPDFRRANRDGDGARSRSPDESGTSTGTVPESRRVPSSST